MNLQELFNDPTNWTQGVFAKRKSNNHRIPCREVPRKNRDKFCFCLLGGIEICYKPAIRQIIEQKLAAYIQMNTDHPNVPQFNDDPNTTIVDSQNLVKVCNV